MKLALQILEQAGEFRGELRFHHHLVAAHVDDVVDVLDVDGALLDARAACGAGPQHVGVDDTALLEGAHQFVTQRDIDDAAWAALQEHLDEATLVEFCLLCGQYDSLATTLITLRVQPEG